MGSRFLGGETQLGSGVMLNIEFSAAIRDFVSSEAHFSAPTASTSWAVTRRARGRWEEEEEEK